MLEGLCCLPWSSVATSARSPCCQISYPGGARTNPSLGSGVLVVWSNHYPLWLCGISIWESEKMPHTLLANSWMSSWPGTFPEFLTTSLTCQTAVCARRSTQHTSAGGRLRCWGQLDDHPPLLCSSRGVSSPPKNSSTCKGQERAGTESPPPVVQLLVWTSQMGHMFPPHPPQGRRGGFFSSGILSGAVSRRVACHFDQLRAGGLGLPSGWLPLVWFCLGDFGLMACSLGSLPKAAQVPAAAWAPVTTAKRAA